MKLSAYLNAINQTKKKMSDLDDDFDTVKKKYSPFVVNRCLSFFPDTLIQSNNMNRYHGLDREMQFDYLRLSTRKRNRFSKWQKKNENGRIEVIMKYFGYNYSKAEEVEDLISDEYFEQIKSEMQIGGEG